MESFAGDLTEADRSILTRDKSHDGVCHGLEEEKPIQHVDFDLHNNTRGNDIEEDDNVDGTNGV